MTEGAEAVDKSIPETSERVSNCIPTVCLCWASLLASLNCLDFEGLFGVFLLFF